MSPRTQGALLILLSAACFGIMPLFGRVAYAAGADAQAILLLRFSIAGLCLAVLMVWRKQPWPRGKLALGLLGMGAIGYAGQAFSYFSALQHASASLTALLLYTFPVIVTLMAAVWLHEPLTRRKLTALVLASLGLALTVGDALSGSLTGIAFGLGAALIYSVYIVVGTKLMAQTPPLPGTALIMVGGALTFGLVSLHHVPAWPQAISGWLAIAAIGVLCSVIAALAFFAGLSRVGASEAAMLSTFEPVVTVVLAAVLLGERLSASQWIGGAVIIIAVLLLAKSSTSSALPE